MARVPPLSRLLLRSMIFPQGVWLVGMSLATLVWMGGSFPPSVEDYFEILKAGEATGTVVRKAVEEGPRGARQMVYYRFETAEGRGIERGIWASKEWYDSAQPGQTFTVYYLKSDPTKNRPMSTAAWEKHWPVPLLAAALLTVGLLAMGFGTHRALWQRRVYESGAEARGEMVELTSRKLGRGQDLHYRVVYRFRDSRGMVREGKGSWMNEKVAEPWREAAGIRVRYDPQHPAHHVLVDDPRPFE